MALNKDIVIAGNTFSYWKLSEVNFDLNSRRIAIKLVGYKDRASRLANIHDNAGKRSMFIPFSSITNWNTDIRVLIYTAITRSILNDNNDESNFWNDATNALE